MNNVERKPVPTRVLNPNASEALGSSFTYRKTKVKKNLAPDSPGAQISSAQTYPTPKRFSTTERLIHGYSICIYTVYILLY